MKKSFHIFQRDLSRLLHNKSGKMNFHGKEITQILLNGKEFFADIRKYV